ncbi:MAG: zinc-binding dehydrogenase [Solirubrobacteraceae bacterium]
MGWPHGCHRYWPGCFRDHRARRRVLRPRDDLGGLCENRPGRRSRARNRRTRHRTAQFAPAEGKRLVERALDAAAAGALRPVVGQTFALEQAAEAHARIESRDVVGKTVPLVDGRAGGVIVVTKH